MEEGGLRLNWARDHMGVVSEIRKRFVKEKPFKGIRIGMALHVEAKTGIFALLLKEGGADVRLSSCNPLSSDDSVVSSLKKDYSLPVFAKKGESTEEYYKNLNSVLDHSPNLVIDDGGDLVRLLHTERSDLMENIFGGNEETTTGVVRLRAMANSGALKFPMFDVNDAKMKHFFDNRYGTGQSVLDGFMHATNLLIAGKNVVVGGYGFCGKGIAMRMKGLGGIVTVTEVDPIKAIEAVMDGFYVDKMENALKTADIVVTATGVKDIITTKQLSKAKSGVVLSNAGHFNNEISYDDLEKNCARKEKVRGDVVRYYLKSGNYVDLVSDGRLVNLASGQGHPVEIMDMSFAIQALVAEYLVKNHSDLKPALYSVPEEIDNQVAEIKLHSLGINIDRYTEEQLKYINSWDEGT